MSNGFRTRSLHAGTEPDPATGARATPIHQTSSYVFDDAETAAELYALQREGDIYSRVSNPTVRALERRLTTLEGGVGGIATASGMAGLDVLTTVLASAGSNIVASSEMYGGTSTYLKTIVTKRGIEPRIVDTLDYEAYAEAIDENTAYVHVETVANPSLVTPDLERIAAIAHENAAPVVVDNTFATPALCRPLEHGADVIWESTTKWVHGGGTTVGGAVIDGGTFPWDHARAEYPELSGENPAFGIDFTEEFGTDALTRALRHRGIRAIGSGQSPSDAWQTLQGIETLPLRMDRHCENAEIVAEYLRDHPAVSWIEYPGFEEHQTHQNASQYLDGGYGGMVTFGLEGGYETAATLCESVELTSFLANVGDAKSLIIHPASTTHATLDEEAQLLAGVKPDMLRMSVGIETPEDIVADLEQGLAAGTGGSAASVGESRGTDSRHQGPGGDRR